MRLLTPPSRYDRDTSPSEWGGADSINADFVQGALLAPEIDHQHVAVVVADRELEAVGRPDEAADRRSVRHFQHDRAAALAVAELQLARVVAAGHELRGRVGGDDADQAGAFVAELHRRLALRALAGERPGGEHRLRGG